MRNNLALLALAATASAASAQGLADLTMISGPQYVNYKIGTGASEKTVTQLAIPIAFIQPIGDRLTIDLSASWADSRVSSNGVTSSKINGLTDTQLRGNFFSSTTAPSSRSVSTCRRACTRCPTRSRKPQDRLAAPSCSTPCLRWAADQR